MLKYREIDTSLRALAEPTRRAIVERLSRGPATVSDLAKPFDMTFAAVAQHLQVLETCGLIRSEKIGRVRTCRIEPAGFAPLADWIADAAALRNVASTGSANCSRRRMNQIRTSKKERKNEPACRVHER